MSEDEKQILDLLKSYGSTMDKNAFKNIQARIKLLREALEQATEQLKTDYVNTPLDGHSALIDKLSSTLSQTAQFAEPTAEGEK